MINNFLNQEGHQNVISGSKVKPFYRRDGFFLLVEFSGKGSAIDGATSSSLQSRYENILGAYMFSVVFRLMLSVQIVCSCMAKNKK